LLSGLQTSKLHEPEWDKAEKCLYWALESASKWADNFEGMVHEPNTGINIFREASVQYQAANASAHAAIQTRLGDIALQKKDMANALQWYEKAATEGDVTAMIQLGNLSVEREGGFTKALEWYEKAATTGKVSGIIVYCFRLFSINSQKEKALELCKKITQSETMGDLGKFVSACIFAWNNQMKESRSMAFSFFADQKMRQEGGSIDAAISLYFTLLLAKNEAQWLFDYFNSPEGEAAQLKDRFKPIWYAILKKLDHPDFLRMGEELAQTVDEILAKAEQMAVEYA
jgi:TPR repeat protein